MHRVRAQKRTCTLGPGKESEGARKSGGNTGEVCGGEVQEWKVGGLGKMGPLAQTGTGIAADGGREGKSGTD